jgi:heme/copper-type cytochrome/quinol oxidase subunit 3
MKVIDVRELPEFAFGRRSTTWWGTMFLTVVEGSMFALLAASFLYLRGNFELWPPTGIRTPDLRLAVIELGLLMVSLVPAHFANRFALDGALRPMRSMLLLTTVLGVAMLVLRGFELDALPFLWNGDAYASGFWAILSVQTLHAGSALLEMATLLVLLFRGPVEQSHLVDVHLGVVGWYFVVLAWLPAFLLLYLERMLGG